MDNMATHMARPRLVFWIMSVFLELLVKANDKGRA